MTNNFKFDEENLAKAIAIEDESNCNISAGVQYERNRIENIDNKYLDGLSPVGVDEYDRLFLDAANRAIELYREWNEITGFPAPGTSYFYEIESCIIDAVHCGLQMGLGIQVPLQSEEKDQ